MSSAHDSADSQTPAGSSEPRAVARVPDAAAAADFASRAATRATWQNDRRDPVDDDRPRWAERGADGGAPLFAGATLRPAVEELRATFEKKRRGLESSASHPQIERLERAFEIAERALAVAMADFDGAAVKRARRDRAVALPAGAQSGSELEHAASGPAGAGTIDARGFGGVEGTESGDDVESAGGRGAGEDTGESWPSAAAGESSGEC